MSASHPAVREGLALLGRALLDHHRGRSRGRLLAHVEGEEEPQALEVEAFFRTGDALHPCDRLALQRARGRVLDIGCGTGVHALELEAAGVDVVAVEILPELARIARERGVEGVVEADVLSADLELAGPWDTVLVLLNGTTMAGTVAGLERLLAGLHTRMAPGGELLIDSTDLWDGEPPGVAPDGRHPGELHYQLEYAGERGPPVSQLFLEPAGLLEAGAAVGWTGAVVGSWEDGRYLVAFRSA